MKKSNISKSKPLTSGTDQTFSAKNQTVHYVGGAGPSEELVKHNNLVLSERLSQLHILHEQDIEFLLELTGVEQTSLLKIQHLVHKGIIYAGYDRWGYVVDLLDTEIDQGDFDETVDAIKAWYFNA